LYASLPPPLFEMAVQDTQATLPAAYFDVREEPRGVWYWKNNKHSTAGVVVLLLLQNGGRLIICWITEGRGQTERKVGSQW